MKCNLFVFQTVVKSICLRRTKTDQVNGRPLVQLPHKKIEVKELEFTEEERTVYAAYMDEVLLHSVSFLRVPCYRGQLVKKSKNSFQSFKKLTISKKNGNFQKYWKSLLSDFCIFSLQGREVILRYMRKGTLMNNYAHLFAIMMRLRQLCCHRELLPINWAGIDMNDLVGWAQRQIQQQGPPGTSLKIYSLNILAGNTLSLCFYQPRSGMVMQKCRSKKRRDLSIFWSL